MYLESSHASRSNCEIHTHSSSGPSKKREDYEFAGTKTPIADLHEEVLSYVQTIEKALMRTSYILAEKEFYRRASGIV